jgi:hypothetical protein
MGLLDEPRECYRGHGSMEKIVGDWAMPQVLRDSNGNWFYAGPLFLVSLYRCPKCGAVEMVDEDKA